MTDELIFVLHDWAPGCPIGFPKDEADELIAHYEPLALDALIAAGKIKPEDRERALDDNYGDWRTPSSDWNYREARTVIARHRARFGDETWDGTV